MLKWVWIILIFDTISQLIHSVCIKWIYAYETTLLCERPSKKLKKNKENVNILSFSVGGK